jgi:signal transduction histidine kinase
VKVSARYVAVVVALSLASIALFYFLNLSNRRAVEAKAMDLAISEGQTIEKVLGKAAAGLLDRGDGPLIRFMDEIFANDQVIYVALKRSGRLLHAASKFEGYLPLGSEPLPVRTFSSPLGEIIEVNAALRDRSGLDYSAHIGYFFSAIEEIRRAAQRSLLLLTLLQAAIVLVLVGFLYSFNRQMGRKEIEIQKEKEEKEKLQEISLVTAGINHEIRNPLHSLYLSYQMLEPRLDPRDTDAAFHSLALKREIKRIQDIIERFSTLTHTLPVRKQPIDLAHFFFERQSAWAAQEKGARITVELEAGARLVSDRELLAQVMDNIVRNAVEAGAGSVAIRLFTRKGTVHISFRDDGQGIKAEQLKFIFDPFVSFKSKGSGIGLALARKIVMQLGGTIEAASVEGQGTEFRIHL